MNKSIMILSSLLLCAFGVSAQIDSFSINGNMRSYLVHAPAGLSGAPLVISMHGANGDAVLQQTRTQFDTLADREKFIVVYPNGRYTNGNHNWDYSGDEDVVFLRALIDTMSSRFHIDRARVYCSGFSLGGMMTHRMACSSADKLAAIVSVSGPLMGGDCVPARPIPVMHIHGLADNTIDYSKAVSTISGWRTREGCQPQPETIDHYPASDPSSKVKYERWGSCNGNSEIILLSVTGGDHTWPDMTNVGFNASEEIWRFFKRHSTDAAHTTPAVGDVAPTRRGFSAAPSLMIPVDARQVTLFNMQGAIVGTWQCRTADMPETTPPTAYIRKCTGFLVVQIMNGDGTMSIQRIVAGRR